MEVLECLRVGEEPLAAGGEGHVSSLHTGIAVGSSGDAGEGDGSDVIVLQTQS
jgi:hypothetical protein